MVSKIKLVYIMGAFTGPDAWTIAENVRAAERVGLEVARAGHMPVIPHANTHLFHGVSEVSDELWYEGTLELMRRCDAAVLVPGWQNSKGTKKEIKEAFLLGLPIYESRVGGRPLHAAFFDEWGVTVEGQDHENNNSSYRACFYFYTF